MSNIKLEKEIVNIRSRVCDLIEYADILEEEGYEVSAQELKNKLDEIITHLNNIENADKEEQKEPAKKGKYKVVLPVSYMAPVCENLYKYFDDKEEAEKWLSDIKNEKVHPNDLYGNWNTEGTEICDDGVSDTQAEPDEAEIITL